MFALDGSLIASERFLVACVQDCKRDGRSLTSPGTTDTTRQIWRLSMLPSIAGLPSSAIYESRRCLVAWGPKTKTTTIGRLSDETTSTTVWNPGSGTGSGSRSVFDGRCRGDSLAVRRGLRTGWSLWIWRVRLWLSEPIRRPAGQLCDACRSGIPGAVELWSDWMRARWMCDAIVHCGVSPDVCPPDLLLNGRVLDSSEWLRLYGQQLRNVFVSSFNNGCFIKQCLCGANCLEVKRSKDGMADRSHYR